MKIRTKAVWASWLLLALLGIPADAFAQTPAAPAPPAAQPQTSDPDSRLDPLQPDFNLAALPTSLRLPVHKMAFRVTHRFSRALGDGDFSDLVSNFFGFDSGARIGLEFRYGLLPGTQIGVHRTSERSIEIFGQQSVMKETKDGHPLSLDILATFEGKDNLRGQKMSAVGAIVSRKIGRFAALYAEPLFVANTNSVDSGTGVENSTTMIGLGTRLRIRPAVYLVGEITPRLSGYKPGVNQASFGLEGRAGGHTFQVNFSNGFGTTLSQIATGGTSYDSWYVGFNISRKFF